MSPEMLILTVLAIPLVTAVAIFALKRVPDLREAATLIGAFSLFGRSSGWSQAWAASNLLWSSVTLHRGWNLLSSSSP